MIWLLGLGLVAACIVVALLVLDMPRRMATVLAAPLVFGLAGYAWQGSPDQPGQVVVAREVGREEGAQLVELRREVIAERYHTRNQAALITADAMARAGRFEYAAALYRGMATDYPDDSEAWLALGNVLVAHADGTVPAAARIAWRRAEEAAPQSAGVPFFLGLSLLRAGELGEARAAWAEAVQRSEPGSEERALMEERLAALDTAIEQAAQSPVPAPER